ncbi:MAG TPA: hypothetical protein VL025_17200 [Thermoanaerobaculia bacterium]|nr:hypothetical protein [Thermoanaerobaculia bacterium]
MSRKKVHRFVAVGVFALALALAGPARAEARELRGPVPVWQWLTALWEHGASALWPGNPGGTTDKQGPETDPNGSPLPNAGSSCGDACDQGLGTDPNGQP